MRKDFKNDTWESFARCAENCDQLFLFGAGKRGIAMWKNIRKYRSVWKIAAFIDNDSSKQGMMIEGLKVLTPQILSRYRPERTVVLICSQYPGSMAEQLSDMGVTQYFSELWLDMEMRDFYEQKDIPEEKVEELLKIVADEESRKVVKKIVEKRMAGFMDYTDITLHGESEYFVGDFFKPVEAEVFIDGGAYTGDTVEEFIDWTKGNYKCIYSFEPDRRYVEELEKKRYRYGEKIRFFNSGLYSSDRELVLTEVENKSSYLGTDCREGAYTVSCIALDKVIKKEDTVTFLKMDIEGAEIEALKGARNVIVRDRPRMAVCIYHKLNDLWEIPALIHTYQPEYKLYIRHTGIRCYGTIVYAVP